MPSLAEERRRSQRLPLWMPLFVLSLDHLVEFSGRVSTVEVSSHGCLVRAPRPFPRGTPLRLKVLYRDRTATAHVIRSDPIRSDVKLWNIALELRTPGNVRDLRSPPQDWGMTG